MELRVLTRSNINTSMQTNLGKQWSSALNNLISLAVEQARQSPLSLKHGAVLFTSKKRVCHAAHNDQGHRVCGYEVPSLHAEAVCMHTIYCRSAREGRHCHQGFLPGAIKI